MKNFQLSTFCLQLLLCTSLFTIHYSLFAQSDSGFTNKAEAKNIKIGGAQEGKWVEYTDSAFYPTKDTNAPYYILTVYKLSKPFGIVRTYYKGGKIYCITPYADGVPNGVVKMFYRNGNLESEIPYIAGVPNGIVRKYYESGKLGSESPFTNGHLDGLVYYYYESGKLKSETMYADGKETMVKKYDKDGNEIK